MVKYIPRPMGGPPRVVVGPAVLSTEHTPRGVEQLIFDKGKLLDANKSKVNVQFDEFPVLIPVRNYGLKAVVDAINEARLSTDFSREADAFVANGFVADTFVADAASLAPFATLTDSAISVSVSSISFAASSLGINLNFLSSNITWLTSLK